MDKILKFLNKFKFLIIALFFIIATVVLLVISIGRGDEILNELNKGVNNNIDVYKNENKDEMVKICLYYIDNNNKKLTEEYREIKLLDYIVNPEDIILNEYIKGSNNPALFSAIPNGTVINKIVLENETLTIDFKEICGDNENIKDLDNNLKIESITKTMKQLKDIEKVKFTIDGNKKAEFCTIKEFDKEY